MSVLAGLFASLNLLCGPLSGPVHAQTNSKWNGGTGNWSDSSNWNPGAVPNNGGGATYDVTINVANSSVTMDVLNDTIDDLKLGSTSTLFINLGDSLSLDSGSSTINGQIFNDGNMNNSGTLHVNVNGLLDTLGTFTNTGRIYGRVVLGGSVGVNVFTNSGTLNGTFDTDGTLINTSTGKIVANALGIDGSVLNYGKMTASGKSTILFGDLSNYGKLTFTSSSVLRNEGGGINNFGLLINNGSISDDVGTFLGNTGTLINTGTYSGDDEDFFDNSGRFINSGTIKSLGIISNAGAFRNSGSITLSSDEVGFLLPKLTNSGIFTNSGSLTISNGFLASPNAFINSGTFRNSGTLTLNTGVTTTNSGIIRDSGTVINNGTFTNSGDVRITKSGVFNTSTNYTQTAGHTFVNGTLAATGPAIVDIQGGILSGHGTIDGNVLMGGTVIAGTRGNPGTLTINGNFEQRFVGIYKELISSSANGLLDISGSASLDPGASLDIDLLGGFDPSNGASFTILDYGSESGTFNISDPFFDHGTQRWIISSYNGGSNDIVLTAEANPTTTPEPSTTILVGTMLLVACLYAGKKRAERIR
jgi:hypothetical protein